MQAMNDILDKIRPNRSALYGFFSMMPKGGDLHHHYSGSVYAESYIDYVFKKNLYVNEETLQLSRDISNLPTNLQADWKKISDVKEPDKLKLKLLRAWSTRDFVKGAQSPDEHFFSTFSGFGVAGRDEQVKGLRELKRRAVNQKVSYIESLFLSVDTSGVQLSNEKDLDASFLRLQESKNDEALNVELEALFSAQNESIRAAADAHTKKVEGLHAASEVESPEFVLRFQNYVSRYKQPTDVFIDLCACFMSCDSSNIIVGVNIVSAENGETSMRDFWLHTMFFKFLETKFPKVKYAVHAGELVGGMVQPENLGTHIKQSLVLNNLKRIGHAVDIIYDNEFTHTIRKMQSKGVAVEINLTSNEFILGVADDLHPVEIYHRNGIPIVICTDDEGVLRTSITEQFALLAHRYKFSYGEVKALVRNSLLHAHIEDTAVKERLLSQLDRDFDKFEADIAEFYQPLVSTNEGRGKLKFMA